MVTSQSGLKIHERIGVDIAPLVDDAANCDLVLFVAVDDDEFPCEDGAVTAVLETVGPEALPALGEGADALDGGVYLLHRGERRLGRGLLDCQVNRD